MEKTRRLKTFSIVALIVAVLGLTIAFAALSKTLTINGTGSVDAANWDIHFDNISEAATKGNASEISRPELSEDKAEINNMKVSLKVPKDQIVYTVDIVNEGDIDATIASIELPGLTSAQEKYFSFKAVYTNDKKEVSVGDIIKGKSTDNITITIKFKDDITEEDLPSSAQNIILSYKMNFVQTDSESGVHAGNAPQLDYDSLVFGDEFYIGEEGFYVIENNSENIVALAKMNVNTITNRQDPSATGIEVVQPYYDNVENCDWDNNGDYCDEIGSAYYSEHALVFADPDTYGHPYWATGDTYPKYVFNENSSLYERLKRYEKYLQNLGYSTLSATLMSYEQAIDLGCNSTGHSDYCEKLPEWVNSTDFWLGSAEGTNQIFCLRPREEGQSVLANPDFETEHGLRPIITILK